MTKAPISLIITTYNDSEYLSQSIESVLAQSLLPTQLIIIDDGSLSYMPKIIANRYARNYPDLSIEYIKKENGGAASARNLGLTYVNQPYVTFLDADDQLVSDSLLKRYKVLEELGNEYFGVYGSAITTEGPNQEFINIDGNPLASKVGDFQQGIPGGCSYYLFRTQALETVGMLDENLTHNEDIDFIIRLLNTGMLCKGSVGYTNKVNIRDSSLSRNTNYEKTFNGIMLFLDKAERENYFDTKHLKYRKKYAHLFLVKRTFTKRPLLAMRHLLSASKYT